MRSLADYDFKASAADGAGEHCEQGNRSLFHQTAFDWLDKILGWTQK